MSVKHGLLALLNRQSMHGYELRRELVDELGPEWTVNYGQVYSTLERLVRDGLVVQSETVSSEEAPDRKLYTVTPAGRTHLRQWFLSPIEGIEAGRDELFAKILLGLTGDVPIDEIIQIERKAQLRRIGELTAAKERLDPQLDLTAVLSADLSIAKTEAVIRWLDAAEAKIARTATSELRGVSRDDAPDAVPPPSDSLSDRPHERRSPETESR
jgi:DNA-binding PadR family transcriptional regulator